ncbi:MAG: PPC domain-containing protein [Yoonia sp.]|uniref:PPC domain-containing protein n=1 Tax=Yoonia sp. TaxID=2212373 RepID=UPI00273DF5B8|nr:PPC domain-containing protein [Yoonia sp.]MDP5086619.1 PPC domain-containing protein [Yoonia sp.]
MPSTKCKSSAVAALLLSAATPALAQSDICGGFGNGGVWIGGDEASSDITTADSYREQMALVLGGNDYVSLFTLTAPTDIRVEAEGRGSGDPIIDLLDGSGGIILSDDDSGGNAASRAETTLEAGTYCMSMRSYDGGPMTAFVRIGRQEQEALTDGVSTGGGSPEGGCETATPFGNLGSSQSASVNETPYWSFTLDAPTSVTITAENESADPVLTLYGPGEAYLAENDDFDGLNSRIDMTEPLDPGTYCLAVTALSDDSAPITVSIGEYDAEEVLLSLYARGEAAPPLDGSIPVTDLGVLQSRLRQDVQGSEDVTWFSLDFNDPGLLVVEAIANGNSDPWLVIYDDLGRQIGQNDDYGDGLDSLVMARVQAGTYIIGVRQFDGGQGFIRLLAERYIRAE